MSAAAAVLQGREEKEEEEFTGWLLLASVVEM
jgi:hypothetical protein